jgi:hypothetical protein
MGRSSLSDSSQSDRGDHSDGEQILPPASPTTYEFAEPKKKRTRTLTTPHQAAVLHALLAQVRPVVRELSPVTEILNLVEVSNYCYAGGSGEADWFECQESSGARIALS